MQGKESAEVPNICVYNLFTTTYRALPSGPCNLLPNRPVHIHSILYGYNTSNPEPDSAVSLKDSRLKKKYMGEH